MDTTDVLIVCAGPNGPTSANELVAGVSSVLIDKLPQRSRLSEDDGVRSRAQEPLDRRGLVDPLLICLDLQSAQGRWFGEPLR